ncbi:MAG: LysR substrate-binding domain-containing protein, partial [Deltaproteobacteria bacterium]|nr:LysR substrate-binding domain-containing protein [Deltaproteobacteria bacterium]
KLVLFAPGNHRLAKRRGLTLSDIAEAPLIIRGGTGEKGKTDEILKKIEKRRLKFNIVMRCESSEAVKVAVRKKMGLGILYWDTVEAEVRRGDFKIIKSAGLPLEGTSFIIYHRKRPLSSDARDFLRLLQQQRYKGRKVR